jgi:hypothetical protein
MEGNNKMFCLQQTDSDGVVVDTSVTYETEQEADAAFKTLNKLMETVDLTPRYTFQIVKGAKCQ